MLKMTVGDIESFLDRFARLRAENAAARFAQFKAAFLSLKIVLGSLREFEVLFQQQTAPHFNIFTILERERREVGTHSRLLAELLDPSGAHGQGDLFLRTFLDLCGRKIPGEQFLALDRPVESFSWSVGTEKWIRLNDADDLGRLDLAISSIDASFFLIIENKVDAAESRDDQVLSYLSWVAKQTQWKRPARKLIYLTIDGGLAQSAPSSTRYLCLSYRDDIRVWLEAALPQIRAPRVSHLINQYLEVVERIARTRS